MAFQADKPGLAGAGGAYAVDATASSGFPTKRRHAPSALAPAKRAAVGDEGACDDSSIVPALMSEGLDRGQAVAAAQAIGDLSHSSAEVVCRCASAIEDLTTAGFCTALVNAGALDGLVAAARAHPGSMAVAGAICTLMSATCRSGSSISAAQAATAAAAVVSSLSHHAPDASFAVSACNALACLASELHAPLALTAAKQLIAAVDRSLNNSTVAVAGITAVKALLAVPGGRSAFHTAGAAALLLRALDGHSSRRDVVLLATCALGQLFSEPDFAADAGTATVVPLTRVLQRIDGDEVLLHAALHTMRQLVAALPSTAGSFLSSGAATSIIAVLGHGSATPAVSIEALSVCAALSDSNDTADALLAAGAVNAICKLLRGGLADNRTVAQIGCRLMAALCEGTLDLAERRGRLGKGFASAVANAMRTFADDEEVTFQCCRILQALYEAGVYLEQLLAAHAHKALFSALERYSAVSRVRGVACAAIWSLTEAEGDRVVVDAGGASAVVNVVLAAAESMAEDALSSCAMALLAWCSGIEAEDDAYRARLLADRVPHALSALLRSASASALSDCSMAMSIMARFAPDPAPLLNAGAADALATALFLSDFRHEEVNDTASDALELLLPDRRYLNLVDFKLVGAAAAELLRVTAADVVFFGYDILKRAVTLLSVLLGGERLHPQATWLCSYGAAEALTKALLAVLSRGSEAHADLHEKICLLLSILSDSPECCILLRKCGAADALVRVLMPCRKNASVVTHACSALVELLRGTHEATTGPLADGRAFVWLSDCIARHSGTASIMIHGLEALGHLAALAPLACRIHYATAAVLAEEAGGRPGTFVLAVLQHRQLRESPATAGVAVSLGALPRISSSQVAFAELAWDSRKGSDAAVSSSVSNVLAVHDYALLVNWKAALSIIAARGRVADVCKLLAGLDCRSGVAADVKTPFALAVSSGNLPLVDHLMARWLADPTMDDCCALLLAAEHGHVDVLERLLSYPGVTPAASSTASVWLAARNGHLSILERLLADPCVDPSSFHNAAIRMACREGHLAVVQRLLADPRVQLSTCCYAPVTAAAASGHLEVLEALLSDPRVDAVDYLRDVADSGRLEVARGAMRQALVRQPSIVREVVFRDAKDSRLPLQRRWKREAYTYTYTDVLAWGTAAWKRRRHAVQAWVNPSSW